MKYLILLFLFGAVSPTYGQASDSMALDLLAISNSEQLNHYLEKYPEASMMLFDQVHAPKLVDSLSASEVQTPSSQLVQTEFGRARIWRDTSIQMVSIKFIYITAEKDKQAYKKVRKIVKLYKKGQSFDDLISKYGNPDPMYHMMINVDTGLLDDAVALSLSDRKIGEVVHAGSNSRYFISQILAPAERVNAYIGIVIP